MKMKLLGPYYHLVTNTQKGKLHAICLFAGPSSFRKREWWVIVGSIFKVQARAKGISRLQQTHSPFHLAG